MMKLSALPLLADATGEDAEDTALIHQAGREAVAYLEGHSWCASVEELRLGLGIGGVVCVFLARIAPRGDADGRLWVVCGDLPSAYLVLDDAPTAEAALAAYCRLMDDWIGAVRLGRGVADVFPVAATPTFENAEALARRLAFIRREILRA